MAIVKEYTTPQGIDANYHRIIRIEISSVTGKLDMVVGIYASKEKAQSGCQPIWHEYVSIPINELSSDPRSAFYPLLTQYPHSYLNGGTDDLG